MCISKHLAALPVREDLAGWSIRDSSWKNRRFFVSVLRCQQNAARCPNGRTACHSVSREQWLDFQDDDAEDWRFPVPQKKKWRCVVRFSEQTCLKALCMMSWILHIIQYLFNFQSLAVTLRTSRFSIKKFCVVLTLLLCLLYESLNKQRLLSYTALTDWFL
jgi:hypothetical protein